MTTDVDTGRLATTLADEAHRIVYDRHPSSATDGMAGELLLISEVDRAHLVMLVERGIVDARRAGALLREVERLRRTGFAEVCARPAPRGVYLAYESLLAETLGHDVGGVAHAGRSRNDLNATTVRLRARGAYPAAVDEVCLLAETLLDRAFEHRGVVMPAYTHGQPAVPITYGHYLAGVASGVLRGLDRLIRAGEELETSPLGAGAVGGTSIPIDTALTARLLGFARTSVNSVDAVASRDFVLALLGEASALGVTVTRVSRDVGAWATPEFGLLHIADDLVGSSSMMPQKRNPFLLEHIAGRATAAFGAHLAAATSMATAGYSNAIAVGTEAVRHLWPGLRAMTDAVVLLRLVVAGATPIPERMASRAEEGHTAATFLAERLVGLGMPFRTAHHRVGGTVVAAIESGESLTEAACRDPEIAAAAGSLAPDVVAEACAYGGGPAVRVLERTVGELRADLAERRREMAGRRDRWAQAERLLAARVADLTGGLP